MATIVIGDGPGGLRLPRAVNLNGRMTDTIEATFSQGRPILDVTLSPYCVYHGEVDVMLRPHGRGTMTFLGSTTFGNSRTRQFSGRFIHGLPFDRSYQPNGCLFEGTRNLQGQPHGYGVLTTPGGVSLEGSFHNGVIQFQEGLLTLPGIGTLPLLPGNEFTPPDSNNNNTDPTMQS